jgi:NAD(P)H-hydrate epimerase
VFAAKAAFHSGAGLVTAALPDSIYHVIAPQLPEALFFPLPSENGHFSGKAADELALRLEEFDAAAIGPGMGTFPGGGRFLASLLSKLGGMPIVVDADALTLLSDQLDLIRSYPGDVISTPHPGEMARLLKTTVREIEKNRLETAKEFSRDYRLFLVLKGHRPVMATPAGDLYILPYGHDALGKGGSGDVLTGLIASFLAQGAKPLEAMVTAGYLHARAAEKQAKKLSRYGVTPLELIDGVKNLLNEMEQKK